jgi:hypothetical protein
MIRIESVSKFIYGLIPFCLRKSKSVRCLVNSVTDKMNQEIIEGQRYVEQLKEAGKYVGQAQVVSERIVKLFGKGIVVKDGSNGNVVIVGRESSYVQIIRNDDEGIFLALPIARTTVGIDFIVEIPRELADKESEIRNWLNSIVFAGVGFEVKIV